jgi:hypothetical protein
MGDESPPASLGFVSTTTSSDEHGAAGSLLQPDTWRSPMGSSSRVPPHRWFPWSLPRVAVSALVLSRYLRLICRPVQSPSAIMNAPTT